MIESQYWRIQLRAGLAWLRTHQRFRRWTEKQAVLFERQLILSAFEIRVLLEHHRIRASVVNRKFRCRWFRKVGSGPVTRLNSHRFDQHFAMDRPQNVELGSRLVLNQLIHHYEMFALREQSQFTTLAVFSDFMRQKGLYFFGIPQLLSYFAAFAADSGAVTSMRSKLDPAQRDYDIVVD